jgi:D-tyrosyl-tRNA(Tyr) deacylase
MRAVVQRVSQASVFVRDAVVGQIGRGLLVLVGVEENDTANDAQYLSEKIIGLRIFEDEQGKMNRSLQDINGAVLVVSQFTLLGDVRRGKRPSFIRAADAQLGKMLYEQLVAQLRQQRIPVATGEFQAQMSVALVNDGPVTILLDSRKQF